MCFFKLAMAGFGSCSRVSSAPSACRPPARLYHGRRAVFARWVLRCRAHVPDTPASLLAARAGLRPSQLAGFSCRTPPAVPSSTRPQRRS
uniref:Uncharacterized protein n=1 Tax=Zea mays TaxID=4577 RepID=B6UFJ7_MAIZE|nr:hypothetical protein [Zea mays]